MGDRPADHDAGAVELRLVGPLSNVEQLDLYHGAGLPGPDELAVAVSPRGCPSYKAE